MTGLPLYMDAVITPNRSLSKRGLWVLMGVLAAYNIVVGVFLLVIGAFPVPVFLGLDFAGIALAFHVSNRRALRAERVQVSAERVEVLRASRTVWSSPTAFTQVALEEKAVELRLSGRRLDVARVLSPLERTAFAEALQRAIRAAQSERYSRRWKPRPRDELLRRRGRALCPPPGAARSRRAGAAEAGRGPGADRRRGRPGRAGRALSRRRRVGVLGLADPDRVSLSNLQRQVIFATSDVGRTKVDAAAGRLAELNPHVQVEAHAVAVDPANADQVVMGYNLVLDGTDDFATRFAVNAACVRAGKPLVSGALGRWTGQVGVFTGKPCYRCLVAEVPPEAETCAAVGVMGALAGVVGSMMALEAIKVLTGAGEPLTGRLLVYDALAAESRTVRIGADPACPVCG